jgi:hypothetical protein
MLFRATGDPVQVNRRTLDDFRVLSLPRRTFGAWERHEESPKHEVCAFNLSEPPTTRLVHISRSERRLRIAYVGCNPLPLGLRISNKPAN